MPAALRSIPTRAALMGASALGASLLLVASPALADNECGTVGPLGIISCPVTGTAYGSITYTGLSGGRTVLLESGVEAASIRLAGTGAISLAAGSTTINTTAAGVNAVDVVSNDRSGISIATGDVQTSGTGSAGISAQTSGAISITSNAIRTTGDQARGIVTANTASAASAQPVTITSGSINTAGVKSTGIDVYSVGSVTVNSTSIETTGDNSVGMLVNSRQGLTVNSGSVITRGDNSDGLHLIGIGAGTITSDSIQTFGDNSVGLWFAGGSENAKSRSIITAGANSHGAYISGWGFDSVYIRTSGDGARGIMLDPNGVGGGQVINSETLITEGDNATGISIGEGRNINPADETTTGIGYRVNGGNITTRGEDSVGILVNAYGNIEIAANAIVTEGFGSEGVALRGANVTTNFQSVTTQGGEAAAVSLFAGGNANVTVGDVNTSGSRSSGLSVQAGNDISIKATKVQTTGNFSAGIDTYSEGDTTIEAADVRTSGEGAHGLDVVAEGDATLTLGYVDAIGADAQAVYVDAEDAVKVSVATRATSTDMAAMSLSGNAIDLSIAANATVRGGTDGLLLSSSTTTTVANAGSISAGSGYAIRATDGASTVDNSGSIQGRVLFGAQADTVNNTGVFDAVGISDFGGANDVFNNAASGVVTVGGTAPVMASFVNLEQFNNAGVIDMANGVAGDLLTLGGVLNSTAGSRVELDVDLSGAQPVADRLNVGGLQGASLLRVHIAGDGVLGETGVTLVGSGTAQTGDEFTIETIGGGFLDYDLAYDATANSYQLVGELAVQAFEPTKAATGAQVQWRRGADMVSGRLAELRDSRGMGAAAGRGQVWAQAFAGEESVDGRNGVTTEDVDLSRDVEASGLQIGADRVMALAGGDAVFGGVIGAGRTELTFDSNGDTTEFESTSIGVYGQWTRGPFAIGGLVKGEFHDMTYNWASADLSDEADGETWGVMLDASMRMDAGNGWFVEPNASVAWNNTQLTGIEDDTGSVEFGDTRSLTGKIGFRAGTQFVMGSGTVVQPYVGMNAHREFDGDNVSTLTFGSTVLDVTDEGRMTWAEGVVGVNVQTKAGFGGFVQAEALGGDVDGFAARLGLRFNW